MKKGSPCILCTALVLASLASIGAACGGAVEARRDSPVVGSSPSVDDPGASTVAPPTADAAAPRDAAAEAPPLLPAGFADGVCSPGDVTLGFYDPDCVYVLGTTMPGSAGREAPFHPDSPTRLAVGWGYYHDGLTIRADRKILFTSLEPRGAYVFAPGLPNETMQAQYARHTLLSTPACSTYLRDVVLYPTSGSGGPPGLYHCIEQGDHYYELGTSTPLDLGGRYLRGLDENGVALVRPTGGALTLVDGGVDRAVSGVASDRVTAVRSKRGGGFLLVATTASDSFPRLYDLDVASGTATERGQYHMGSFQLRSEVALEPSGALEAVVAMGPITADGIVRLRIDAVPEVLFDETKNVVQLHGAQLVTGP